MEPKKKKNNLFTKSYVIKRLIENKFYVKHLIDSYPKSDSRYWTILINPGKNDIILTCIRNYGSEKVQFRVYSKSDSNILVDTESLNVLINILRNITTNCIKSINMC
jgi:hypothetical protein